MSGPFSLSYRNGFNPHMLPKVRSEAIMDMAEGAPCTLRLCSFFTPYRCSSEATTVGAHMPVFGKGVSTKVTDLAVVFACGRCHDIQSGVDLERYNWLTEKYPSVLPTRIMHAMAETWTFLVLQGVIVIPDAEIL